MPPYDPNAKRPKLVPVDDEAPVDAILGPDPSAEHPTPALISVPAPDDESDATPVEPEPQRPHLSVVPPETSRPQIVEPVVAHGGSGGGPGARKLIAAVVAVVAVIGVVAVLRRRS